MSGVQTTGPRALDPAKPSAGSTRNQLLRLLSQKQLSVLMSKAERVELKPRQVIHHWRLPLEHVYFIETGLISISAKVDEGRFVEVWLIGSEGMVGARYVLVADGPTPRHRRVVREDVRFGYRRMLSLEL